MEVSIVNAAGSPVSDAVIVLFSVDGEFIWFWEGDNGSYHIAGLDLGRYKLFIATLYIGSDYANEWYPQKRSFDEAEEIAISEDSCTPVDVILTSGVCIGGSVVDPAGEPFQGEVYAMTPDTINGLGFFSAGTIAPDGGFEVQNLLPGKEYWLVAFDTDGNYVFTGYPGSPIPFLDSRFPANWLSEYTAALTEIEAPASGCKSLPQQLTMIKSASLTGTVSGIELEPGEKIILEAYLEKSINGQEEIIFWDKREEATAGTISPFTGLIPGDYILIAYVAGEHYRYAGSFHDGILFDLCGTGFQERSDENDPEWLTYLKNFGTFRVNGGQEIEKSFLLKKYGSIKGKVTMAESVAIEDISVNAVRIDGEGNIKPGCNDGALDVSLDSDGAYAVENLSPGFYKVWAAYGNDKAYFNNTRIECKASLVAVSFATEISPVSFSLGSIQGTVALNTGGASNTPLGVKVTAYDSNYNPVAAMEIDNIDGNYSFKGLPPGDYYLKAAPPDADFPMIYYSGAESIKDATKVSITTAEEEHDIAFHIQRQAPGSISGIVTDSLGEPLEGASVFIFEEAGNHVTNVTTDSNGFYTIANLAPGGYWLYAKHTNFYYNKLYDGIIFNDYDSLTMAEKVQNLTTVVVAAATSISDIDFILEEKGSQGSISGTVMSEFDGTSLTGSKVTALAEAGNIFTTQTAADGTYTIDGLPEGTYLLYIRDDNACLYEGEFYKDAPVWQAGSWVEVTAPNNTGPINFDLAYRIFGEKPSINTVSPAEITVDTTPEIIITGENFVATPEVFIGDYACTGETWQNSTSITAAIPSNIPEGTYHLKVKNPSGQAAILLNALKFSEVVVPDDTHIKVRSIFPGKGIPPVNVFIGGSNFKKENNSSLPRVKLGTVSLANISYIDSTGITATVPVHESLIPGIYDLTVTNPDSDEDTLEDAFTVLSAEETPALVSITPDQGYRGQTLDITILGRNTNFEQDRTVVSLGSGITVSTITVTGKLQVSANITIAQDAIPGSRDVIVTTADEEVSKMRGFSISGTTAYIVSVNPSEAEQGVSPSITIKGEGTHFLQGISVISLGADITINNISVSNLTQLSASISIADYATPGPRDVAVTTGAEIAEKQSAFAILSQGSSPVLISINPESGEQGERMNVAIQGEDTHFNEETTVSFGSGIETEDITITDSTHLIVQIGIDAEATPGLRDVTATTGDEVAAKNTGFLVVTEGDMPSVKIFPASGVSGKWIARTKLMFIKGQNTNFKDGITDVAFAKPGIEVMGKVCLGSKLIVLMIAIMPNTEAGPSDVSITTGAEKIVIEDGFTVR